MKPGRNDPCPCGSGKKYKKCCHDKLEALPALRLGQQAAGVAALNDNSKNQPTPAKISQLIALFNSGLQEELEIQAHLLIEQYPNSGLVWKVLGASFLTQGKVALPALQKAAELLPDDAEAQSNFGNALQEIGEFDNAVASFRRALKLKPDFAEAHYNLGNALLHLNQLDDAVTSYRRALKIKPDYAIAHSNLGSTLKDLGQLDDAVASFRRALKVKPDYAEAHNHLGNTLRDLGQLDNAVESYRRALEIKPDSAEAYSNLGIALGQLGQFENAVKSYRRALEIKPDSAEAYCNLGMALGQLGQLDSAIESFHRALKIKPDLAEAHCNLGNALQELGQIECMASYRRALEIKPDFAEAHCNIGNALMRLGQVEEAMASFRRALKIYPDYPEAHNNLGKALLDIGKIDDAVASFRHANMIKPNAHMYTGLLFSLCHFEDFGSEALFAEHCHFGELFEAPLRAHWPKHNNSRIPERCLQVGFVSGDFRNHAVASFIEPVLEHLSKCPQLSLHAYYNHFIEDAVTQRLKEYFKYWHPIAGLSDATLAEKIRAEGIDILIDLSGHSDKHRLLTFARKPAPVQASWIGYPGTTGLQAMDYFLTDQYFLPQGQFDSQFTEKILRLPASAPFLPSTDAPSVNSLPALSNGYVTFGSFNRQSKISRSNITLWSQLLHTLPNSRMLLGGLSEEGKYNKLIEWFAQEGITRERLDFHPRSGMNTYLGLHHNVDICLDTFPYNGGTTTLHALWMGVPTLTLTGRIAATRSGASILGHVSLQEFIACDSADFVQRGLFWAGNFAALSDIRSGLRDRFVSSAMGQSALVAKGLECALRLMWQRWCDGKPAETFEVRLQEKDNAIQEAYT